MSLLKELQDRSDKKFFELLDEFSETVTNAIMRAAEKGWTETRIRVDRAAWVDEENKEKFAPLINHPKFEQEMQRKFSEFHVSLKTEKNHFIITTTHKYLVIKWQL